MGHIAVSRLRTERTRLLLSRLIQAASATCCGYLPDEWWLLREPQLHYGLKVVILDPSAGSLRRALDDHLDQYFKVKRQEMSETSSNWMRSGYPP